MRWSPYLLQFCQGTPYCFRAKKWIPSKVMMSLSWGGRRQEFWTTEASGICRVEYWRRRWAKGLLSSLQRNWPCFHSQAELCLHRPSGEGQWWGWELNGDIAGCAVTVNMNFWLTQNKETSLSTSGIQVKFSTVKALGIWVIS